jgi:helicase
VLGALRGRRKTAETILENVGRQDPSMAGIDPDGNANSGSGSSNGRDGSTGAGSSAAADRDEETGTTTSRDQASLGDFG